MMNFRFRMKVFRTYRNFPPKVKKVMTKNFRTGIPDSESEKFRGTVVRKTFKTTYTK